MIEMMLGIILVMILLAGVVLFADVSLMHGAIDSRIRGDAGVVALSPLTYLDIPDYIRNWREGPDGQRLTADDQKVLTSPNALADIANRSVRAGHATDWAQVDEAERRSGRICSLKSLKQTPVPVVALGFVGVRIERDVQVPQSTQDLLYNSPVVKVQEETWVPECKDLY